MKFTLFLVDQPQKVADRQSKVYKKYIDIWAKFEEHLCTPVIQLSILSTLTAVLDDLNDSGT